MVVEDVLGGYSVEMRNVIKCKINWYDYTGNYNLGVDMGFCYLRDWDERVIHQFNGGCQYCS